MVSNNNNTHQNDYPFNLDPLLQNPVVDRQIQPRRDKVDTREKQPALSSTQAFRRFENQQKDNNYSHVDVPVAENANQTIAFLLTAINQTNRLLYQ